MYRHIGCFNELYGNVASKCNTAGLLTQWFCICTGDDSGSYFRGNRYTKDGDEASMLLFDVNGYIAGMQVAVSAVALFSMCAHRSSSGVGMLI